jgi:P63C domain
MSDLTVSSNISPFDSIKHTDSTNQEYWLAREVMPLLEYMKWTRFEDLIARASQACINSDNPIQDHLSSFEKVVERSTGGSYTLKDYKMSRYFCYLLAMNGDSRKPAIANAQSYFATKTREAELATNKQYSLQDIVQEYARIHTTEYLPEFWEQLYRVTGYKRTIKGYNPAFSHIINKYVYELFPDGTLAKLQELNPIKYRYPKTDKHSGLTTREFKHHQLLSDIVGLPTLQAHVETMTTVMRILPDNDIQAFYQGMDRAFPNGARLNVTTAILDLPGNKLPSADK